MDLGPCTHADAPGKGDAPHTGTTIVAVSYNGGVVLGADGRVSTGTYISNRASNKIQQLTDNVFLLRSGSAADTQAIGDYVRYFDPKIVGLTGSLSTLAAVERLYGAQVVLSAPGEPVSVSHSDYLYLIDDLGRVRKLFDQQASVAAIVQDIRLLQREAQRQHHQSGAQAGRCGAGRWQRASRRAAAASSRPSGSSCRSTRRRWWNSR